jgi:hypothetical protein
MKRKVKFLNLLDFHDFLTNTLLEYLEHLGGTALIGHP